MRPWEQAIFGGVGGAGGGGGGGGEGGEGAGAGAGAGAGGSSSSAAAARAEIERLLKHGAYGALSEDAEAALRKTKVRCKLER